MHDDLPEREAFGTAPGHSTEVHAARTHDSKAAQVKNEGAFPYVDARTARVEEGNDDESLMPPAS